MPTYPVSICEAIVDVRLPDRWQVKYFPIRDLPALSEAQIREALAHPIGTPSIRELAQGKKTAVVIVEDVTRPLRGEDVVPYVIEEIHAGGIAYDNIKIIIGLGAHRPMAQREFRAKLGDRLVDNFLVLNNNPYENQVYVGTTPAGTPVDILQDVAEADLKVTVGALIPHNAAGFTGGGKLILPGVCSMRTIFHHHSAYQSGQASFGGVDNPFRLELEAVARLAGLDVIVEAVLNSRLDVVGLFVGDVVQAHRTGVQMAEQVYTVQAPAGVDVGIVSGFPRDIELPQGMAALAANTGARSVRSGGTILFMAAAQEGVGYHSLRDKMQVGRKTRARGAQDLVVYSPRLSFKDAAQVLPEGTKVFDRIEEAVDVLEAAYPQATVNVFPQGAMTIFQPA